MFLASAIASYYFSKNNIKTVLLEKRRIAHLILIRDNSDPYNYLRTTVDNRIIIGGEDVDFIPDIFNEKLA